MNWILGLIAIWIILKVLFSDKLAAIMFDILA